MNRGIFAAIGILVATTTFAAPIYKCKDDKGNVVFTDKKCDSDAKPKRVWDNHLGDVVYPATFSGATPDEVQAGMNLRAGIDSSQAQAVDNNADGKGGFLCSTGRNEWVQDTPCPAMLDEDHTTYIQHSDGTGSSITSDRATHVHQTQLSHDALCRNLSATTNTFERNRIARSAGCN